jgi:hypothetical protein
MRFVTGFAPRKNGDVVVCLKLSKLCLFGAWLGVRVASCRMSGPILLWEPTDLVRERTAFAPNLQMQV